MSVVAIVQARTSSTRLPRKVLADVAGVPMIAHTLRALQRTQSLDAITVATTTNADDDPVVAVAEREGIGSFRGSEHDVLRRYAGAARQSHAHVVVRITADCPLIDPVVVDRVVAALEPDSDYASNVIERTYPVGLDVEALFSDVLYRLDRISDSAEAREHVTWFIREERPELFVCRSVVDEEDNSDLRWTVDTADDLAVVRSLFDNLNLASNPLSYREIVAHARRSSVGITPR